MFAYSLYGLTLRSNLALPMLESATAPGADVVIDFVDAGRPMPRTGAMRRHACPVVNAAGESPFELWQLGDDAGFWLRSMIGDGWAEYLLAADGARVEVMVHPGTPLRNLFPPLLGLVMPLVLRLRGVTCLHASAVLAGERVVAFTGPSETGKSTTLLAMLRRGYGFFSDDLVALHAEGGRMLTYGGYPQVGVLPDTMGALFGTGIELPYLWDDAPQRPDKRIYQPRWHSEITAGVANPLAVVYLLAQRSRSRDGVRIRDMGPRDAVTQLVPHTTGNILSGAAGRAVDLERLSALVRTTPVRLIERPDDLAGIDELAIAIDADLARLTRQDARWNTAEGR